MVLKTVNIFWEQNQSIKQSDNLDQLYNDATFFLSRAENVGFLFSKTLWTEATP